MSELVPERQTQNPASAGSPPPVEPNPSTQPDPRATSPAPDAPSASAEQKQPISEEAPSPSDAAATPGQALEPQDPAVVCVLADGVKVKRRMLRMRACNEKNEKGKLCAGHLKRWFRFGAEVATRFGADAEIYRCEKCRTLYLPHPDDPRTGSLCY